MPPPDARLAQIVEACPHDVADDIGEVAGALPVAERVARVALRLPEDALRSPHMVGGMPVHHVVVAHDVERFGVRVVDFPVVVPGAQGLGHRACVVVPQHLAAHIAGGGHHIVALGAEVAGDVQAERRVAIGMGARLVAVHVDAATLVDAVEAEADALAPGRGEPLAVGALAAGIVASAVGCGGVGPRGVADVPVVGQVHGLPAAVVVGGRDGLGHVGLDKPPPHVEQLAGRGGAIRKLLGGGSAGGGQCDEKEEQVSEYDGRLDCCRKDSMILRKPHHWAPEKLCRLLRQDSAAAARPAWRERAGRPGRSLPGGAYFLP